jgi:PTH1 family peptidyl-tRNA hydrolase
VVGLGNPGPRYEATRHNMGFLVVDRLASRGGDAGPWRQTCGSVAAEASCGGEPVLLAKPQTFMNRSGEALRALAERTGLEPDRILVVHDDLDLPFGRLRVRIGGGAGGHNGIRSAVESLGTGEFIRLKVGIGRPEPGGDVVEFVLSPFAPEEQAELPDLLGRAADVLGSIIVEGPLRAMNRFHT